MEKPKSIMLVSEEMRDITVITPEYSREPTKWEVLRALWILSIYGKSGSGLSRKLLSSAWTRFWAAPLKASHASLVYVKRTTPESFTSDKDTP